MNRTMLKSKIHRCRITDSDLHYVGSITVDEDLLDAADIQDTEQVHVWNVNHGERLVTYAIRAERGSGIVSLNGSAARRASVGDLVIVASFCMLAEAQAKAHRPRLVFVDVANRISHLKHQVEVQVLET